MKERAKFAERVGGEFNQKSLTEVSDIQKYYLLGFLFFTMLIEQGCSPLNKVERDPAMMVGLIGPKGEAILFYKEHDKIVVKQCENYTVLKLKSNCKVLPGTVVQNISVSDFKDSLKMALKLPSGNYDADTKKKIEHFNNRENDGVEELLKKQRELKSQVSKIEAFIKEFGVGNVDSGHLLSLKETLSQVNGEPDGHLQLGQIVQEINGSIDNLVDRTISEERPSHYTFSEHKTGFVFNILRAFNEFTSSFDLFSKNFKGKLSYGEPSR